MRCLALCAVIASLTAPAFAATPTEAAYLEATLGTWSTKAQSVSEDYDWVGSQKWQIMTEAENGIWVYQENTIFGANPDAEVAENPTPYFQVVIHFRDLGDGLLHTTTHRVADRASARAFAKGERQAFDKAWLGDVACMGRMQQVGDGYWSGSATCPNGYKGGVKVESRSVFTPGAFINWDRGFSAAGEQIWGPASGGYIFDKEEPRQ